jgi:S1-C subfamily serine protease
MRRALPVLLVAFLFGALLPAAFADDNVCPRCGAPLEPGAAFCTRCGQKIEVGPARAGVPQDDVGQSVVQVVAAHDQELTSTFGAIAFGSAVKVDSILGSAFPVAPGEFVTDSGVLAGAREVMLHTASGRSAPAHIVGIDPMIGVGLLSADLPEVPVVKLRAGGLPRLGEGLTAVGFPSQRRTGQKITTSAGVVSGLHRGEWRVHPIEDYIQTDASLPDGFAGGPMVDGEGRVVGMSTAWVFGSIVVLGPGPGIGISIPVEWMQRSLEWIRAGRPPRAWIGAYTVPADSESRALYGLPANVRRVVEQVFPGTPAALAGLKTGDGILTLQGEEAVTLAGLHDRLLKTRAGEPLDLVIARRDRTLPLHLSLAARPDRARLTALDALRFYGGVELAPQGDRSLVVRRVLPGSLAADAKVAPGDELQSLLGKKDLEHASRDNARWRSVKTVEDLDRLLDMAYSDFDFYVGLRFKSRSGVRRELSLWAILGPSSAL